MVPNFERFFYPFLQLMSDGQAHKLKDLVLYCAAFFQLSDEDKQEMTKKGSFTKLYDRSQWTATYLRKAKLIESVGRGIYTISKRGLSFWSSATPEIGVADLQQYNEFREFAKGRKGTEKGNDSKGHDDDKTPTAVIHDAYEEINSALADELLETIKDKSPQFFEKLVIKLLVAMGYGGSFEDVASVTKYSHDEGIDGIIKEDKVGLR